MHGERGGITAQALRADTKPVHRFAELDLELRASHVREQIALTMPHLLQPKPSEPEPLKKTKPSKVLDRLQKDRHRRHRP